jgi:hypothetical protein
MDATSACHQRAPSSAQLRAVQPPRDDSQHQALVKSMTKASRYHGPAVNPAVTERNRQFGMCPTCGAETGEPCRNPRGYVVPTHKRREPKPHRAGCEQGCGAVATVYAMGRLAGDWGGRYCESCAKALGFVVTDRLAPEKEKGEQ